MKKLTSNSLKIIAIVAMIIDHIGYYFYNNLPFNVYISFRIIGRIAMPIFVFILVQGFMKTSNIKKYITRIIALAVVTQVCITLVRYVNIVALPSYVTNVLQQLNIVFSFALSLIILCMIDKKTVIIKNRNTTVKKIGDILIRIFILITIIATYLFVPIDYAFIVPILVVTMYLLEIMKEKVKLKYIEVIYVMGLFITIFCTSLLYEAQIQAFAILAFPFLLFYNGKLGKKSDTIKQIFYLSFPAQHILLYILSMILYDLSI